MAIINTLSVLILTLLSCLTGPADTNSFIIEMISPDSEIQTLYVERKDTTYEIYLDRENREKFFLKAYMEKDNPDNWFITDGDGNTESFNYTTILRQLKSFDKIPVQEIKVMNSEVLMKKSGSIQMIITANPTITVVIHK